MKVKKFLLPTAVVLMTVAGIGWLQIGRAQQGITESTPLSDAAGKQKATEVVKGWKSYLRQFKTVEMSWMTEYQPVQANGEAVTDNENKSDAEGEITSIQGKGKTSFLLDGNKHRSDLWDIGTNTVEPQTISVFDGTYFHQLRGGFSLRTFSGDLKHSPYERTPPFIDIFSFTLDLKKMPSVTLPALQSDNLWSDFLKNVKEVSRELRDGRKGTKLIVDNAEQPVSFEIWVDDEYALPTQWKTIEKKTGELVANGSVVEFFLAENPANAEAPILLPAKIVSFYERGGKRNRITLDVDTKTLKINEAIGMGKIMIPFGKAKLSIDSMGRQKRLDVPDPGSLQR